MGTRWAQQRTSVAGRLAMAAEEEAAAESGALGTALLGLVGVGWLLLALAVVRRVVSMFRATKEFIADFREARCTSGRPAYACTHAQCACDAAF